MSAMPAVVPDFFTVPEAGRILRIGRNSAYNLAAEFEDTDGRSGLPFVRLGKLKRVPRLALEKLLGGPITWPIADDVKPRKQRATSARTDAAVRSVEAKPAKNGTRSNASSSRECHTTSGSKKARSATARSPRLDPQLGLGI